MEVAVRADGVRLIITSGYRSDAEQAELHERNPIRGGSASGQVATRHGAELDLGPAAVFAWLARNARRFHFMRATNGKLAPQLPPEIPISRRPISFSSNVVAAPGLVGFCGHW